ncbi:hypothetical protein DPEC_G00361880 [Dallia pectoralis]|nr:hypothetical protein DPEC_G00361880 [Dallia pectoralis]
MRPCNLSGYFLGKQLGEEVCLLHRVSCPHGPDRGHWKLLARHSLWTFEHYEVPDLSTHVNSKAFRYTLNELTNRLGTAHVLSTKSEKAVQVETRIYHRPSVCFTLKALERLPLREFNPCFFIMNEISLYNSLKQLFDMVTLVVGDFHCGLLTCARNRGRYDARKDVVVVLRSGLMSTACGNSATLLAIALTLLHHNNPAMEPSRGGVTGSGPARGSAWDRAFLNLDTVSVFPQSKIGQERVKPGRWTVGDYSPEDPYANRILPVTNSTLERTGLLVFESLGRDLITARIVASVPSADYISDAWLHGGARQQIAPHFTKVQMIPTRPLIE